MTANVKFDLDEINWDDHGVPVLQVWNAAMPGCELFECVAFFIADWFHPGERATRICVHVWARDRDEALAVSHDNWRLFCDLPNLLNWWARPVPMNVSTER
jgi:hypothetical protein